MEYLDQVLTVVSGSGAKLLYAEDFVYFDGVRAMVELLIEGARALGHDLARALCQYLRAL